MKKIININLSGRVIPIEDSAYEKLQAYIESLRRYFSNEEGRDEIINDIESRIAELMNEKIRKGASCITDADIEEIAQSMGRPEDFDAEAAADATESAHQSGHQQSAYTSSSSSSSEKKSRGRLYRDTSDKFIGGVCSGIAAYMNVDPAIVRILFAIITFGGFGLGFLAYILLWIILPTKDLEGYSGKRLYRNPEDRVIGGVAGGLAAYFNRSTATIRLIFAAPILFSILFGILDGISWHNDFDFFPNIVFGSISSTFILAYVILWIVLPEAHSTHEKMEMRGEKVDVNSIRQNMKDRMKTWGEEVKESAQNISDKAKEFANTRGKTFTKEFNETARRGGSGLGHAIGVIFKVFFFFIFGTIAFGLFVALIALLFGGIAWWPVNNFLWTSNWQQIYAWGTLIFFLLVPLVGFMLWLFRRIIGVKRSRSNYLGWTFGFLWTVGWVAAILLASSLSKDFREYEHSDTPINLSGTLNEKIIVAVSQNELEYTGRGSFDWFNNDDGEGWDLSSDTLKLSFIRFDVKVSPDSAFHVTMKKYGYGRTEEQAMQRAEKIQYAVYSRDSVLDLANSYAIDKDSKFRLQQVEVEIMVPVGKKIRFDESVTDKLNPANFRIKKRYRNRRVTNIDINNDFSFRFHTGVDYTMGIDGSLKDPQGRTPDSYEYRNYRYDENQSDSARLQRELENRKREQERLDRQKEENDRIIKDLEEKQKQKSTGKLESMDDKEDVYSGSSPSPIMSLTSWIY
jgi:phage shock protein PspC (stress-responsive transcriptional regulator)